MAYRLNTGLSLAGMPPLPGRRGTQLAPPAAVQARDRKEQLRDAHPAFVPPPAPGPAPTPLPEQAIGGLQLDPEILGELPKTNDIWNNFRQESARGMNAGATSVGSIPLPLPAPLYDDALRASHRADIGAPPVARTPGASPLSPLSLGPVQDRALVSPDGAAQAMNSRAVEQASGKAFGLRAPDLAGLGAEPDPVTDSESRAWRTMDTARTMGLDLTSDKSIPLVSNIYSKEGEVDPVAQALRQARTLEAQARTAKLTSDASPEHQEQLSREREAKINNLVAMAAQHGIHLNREKLALERDPQRLDDLHNNLVSLAGYRSDQTGDRRAALELRRRELAAAWEQRAEKEAREAGQQVDKRAESADEFLAKHQEVLEAANPEGFFAKWGRRLTPGGGLSPADQARAELARREAERGQQQAPVATPGANPFAAPVIIPQGGAQPTQIFSSAAPPGPAVTPGGPPLANPTPDPKKVAQFQWVAANHPDPATRQRAVQRLAQWGIK